MKKHPLLLLLFCCTLFFSACSDDDDATPSKEDMLMNKRWQITALEVALPIIGSQDLYEDFEDCEKDNFIEFRANGVVTVDEGATKCDDSNPQQYPGTWTLEGDVLTIKGAGSSFGLPVNDLKLTITQLSGNSLEGEFSQSISGYEIDGTVTLKTM
ncbi:lipocalin family protein [Rufibacter sediminis]|uniref:Lipocalin family protein n=1 Tax=Rufibacter sediminis TaxID=2762756 RepID=A0ABR6VU66_9BACT|nr:lipocalin family protein [Rufibacter sediminis]MBC3540751.1 lipocalin family protein [Rufibacter sediminis]